MKEKRKSKVLIMEGNGSFKFGKEDYPCKVVVEFTPEILQRIKLIFREIK